MITISELDVINDMVSATGRATFPSEQPRHPVYRTASRLVARHNSAIQAHGWWYNQYSTEYVPNTDGEIILPANLLSVDPTAPANEFIQRAGKLYNPAERTYDIGMSVVCNIIELVPIGDIPASAQEYLRAMCVYVNYVDAGGTAAKITEYAKQLSAARALCFKDHIRGRDTNFFNSKSYKDFISRGSVRQRRLPL